MSEVAPASIAPRRVVLFNVKYSPNLGDGVIAECLQFGLAARLPGTEFQSIDLAGRAGWTVPTGAGDRVKRLALLQKLPVVLRDAVVGLALGAILYRRLLPRWRAALANADFAVFGGGQLIQDGDLNFPIKLAGAAGLCDARRIPSAVFGVGVSRSRSRLGRHLLRRLLVSPGLTQISVRDAESRLALASYGVGLPVGLSRDPGLLAADLWPVGRPAPRPRPVVGVCITHPVVLRHHGHGPDQALGRDDDAAMAERYGALVDALVAQGSDVLLFTNGAAEDEDFLAASQARLRACDSGGLRVAVQPRAATPRELAATIARLDGLVAHRLHAVILAYAYRVPAIGLRWDGKLDAFLRSVGHEGLAATFDAATIPAIPARLAQAIAAGIDPATHARVVAETGQGLDTLAGVIASAAALSRAGTGIRPQAERSDVSLPVPSGF